VTWYSNAPGNDLFGSPLMGTGSTPEDGDGAGAGAPDVLGEPSPKRENMRRASRRWTSSAVDGSSRVFTSPPIPEHGFDRCNTGSPSLLPLRPARLWSPI
jgi:hypothetical protein